MTTSASKLYLNLSPPRLAGPYVAADARVQFPSRFLHASWRTSSTSQGCFHRRFSSNPPRAFLLSREKENAVCTLPPECFGTPTGPGLTRNVRSRRGKGRTSSRRRAVIKPAAAGFVNGDSSTYKCLYLKRTVADGEVVKHSGTVVILGDVEAGGHVIADGDVIVLGKLQGLVHAGRGGTVSAGIFATIMEPRGIQLCDSAAFCPEIDRADAGPKVAMLSTDGSLSIFPAAPKMETQRNEVVRNQRPAKVALGTGIYISLAGIALLGFPKSFFGILFDLQGVAFGWVRVGAILAVLFGIYYVGTAIGDLRGMNGADAFYRSTVVGRVFLFLSFAWLVVTGAVPRALLLIGLVNLVGAMAMWKSLS